jgi:hypothetical protein
MSWPTPVRFSTVLATLILLVAEVGLSQQPLPETGVLRLRVRVKSGETTRGLARKRFFLIKGSLEQNRVALETATRATQVSRDCYYNKLGASKAFIEWLRANDCESVYCREVANDDLIGPKAVPEFITAMAAVEKEVGNKDLARKWLTTQLPEDLRDGFYKERQSTLNQVIKQARALSGASVLSVMTDRNGTAYFTDLEPGTYVLSNLIGTEIGSASVTWNCEVSVKRGDIATEKPYLVSNRQDRNVKCVGVEKPLELCDK